MTLIITLIILGLILIAIELLIIPGFGLAGILGLLSIVGAVVLSFTNYGQSTGLIVMGSVILLLSLGTWLVLRSGTWRRLTLNESISSKVDSRPSEKGLEKGTSGIALSRLAPAGKARFGNNDTEVHSQEGIIPSGSKIEITRIEESKIFVRQIV